jgi:DNA-binding HxlR family transcriptional regulator
VKSYRQFCSVAKALDVVGDRWALLVVRELLLGPRRYTDLLEGLPGIGTNVLSTRLRELEGAGVVTRRRLPPPAPATVYELTDDGRDLRAVLQALGAWGQRRLVTPADGDTVEPRWFIGSVASTLDRSRLGDPAVFGLDVDEQRFTLEVRDQHLIARHGAPDDPVATLTGRLRDFFAAYRGDQAAASRIAIDGDARAGTRLLTAITDSGTAKSSR